MLILLTLLGCPTPTDDTGLAPLDADFEVALEGPAGGCADVWMYAANDDNTIALFFHVGDAVGDACAAAAPTTFTYTMPESTVELRVEQGSDLTVNECNDVMDETGPEVVRTWTASAGTATLLVEPTNTEYCESDTTPATLTLTDVTFTADDGAGDVVIESLVISANVGWLPG